MFSPNPNLLVTAVTTVINAIPSKTTKKFFIDIDKLLPKLVCNIAGPRIVKTTLAKKITGGIYSARYSGLLCSPRNQTAWYWQRDRHTGQWN